MSEQQIRFSDGASYDAMMGVWSRSAGALFLDWLQPEPGLEWLDVGCGTGAFMGLVVERCAPKAVLGVDPSAAQLEFARSRLPGPMARVVQGDAMAIPRPNDSADVAVAALVTHFIADPARAIAEMVRVVRPGGWVGAYTWDLLGGGFPYEAVHVAMRGLGLAVPAPPHPQGGDAEVLERFWLAAGLACIRQHVIVVSRTFRDVEDYWQTATRSPRIAAALADVPAPTLRRLEERVRAAVEPAPDGTVTPTARANAIVGTVPGPALP